LGEFGEAGGDAADGQGLFAGVDVGDEMDFDAAGEIEASLDGCVDDGDLFEADHLRWDLSCVRVMGGRIYLGLIIFVREIFYECGPDESCEDGGCANV
jgi:hypothetical protein